VVAEAMSRFKPGRDGEPGLEELLRRMTQERPHTIHSEQVVALADAAQSAARRIEGHDPGRHRADWIRYTREMGTSARQLAMAAEAHDHPAVLVAAARLQTACSRCHETFRE
jgi:hypothetical protein